MKLCVATVALTSGPTFAAAGTLAISQTSGPAWVQVLIGALVIAALARLVWASR